MRLEAVRGLAAIYVFVGHCLFQRFFDKASFGPLSYLFRCSQEVIMAFFLISGFVIFYSVASKPQMRFADYARARIFRIMPILLLALLVSYVLAAAPAGPAAPGDKQAWFGAVFFLADEPTLKPGVWFSPFYGNDPLWTLTYEWWFYFLFWPIYRHVPIAAQRHVVLLLAVIGLLSYTTVPNQVSLVLSYFPIWWVGVELARCTLRDGLKRPLDMLVPLGQLALLGVLRVALLPFSSRADIHRGFGYHPLLELRHLVAALVIAVLALAWHRAHWRFFDRLIGPFAVVAPMSFALYILHYPIIVNAHFLDWIAVKPIEYAGYVMIALLAAHAAEAWYQPVAVRLAARLWPPRRRTAMQIPIPIPIPTPLAVVDAP